jgi:hypothetical protein
VRVRTTVTVLALCLALVGCDLLGGGNVFELAVGDCFDDAAGDEEISDVPIVDCAEPHDNEVFHVFDLAEGDFPGEDALLQQAQDTCVPVFASYVGQDLASSQLDVFPITPTAASWSGGDREIICALYDADLAKLEGSMRDSGV